MPRITISELPKVSRGSKTSAFSAQQEELAELLADEDARTTEGLVFEVTDETLDAMVSALRKTGQAAERKVNTVRKGDQLFVKDGGVYTGRQPKAEAKAEKAPSRRPKAAQDA